MGLSLASAVLDVPHVSPAVWRRKGWFLRWLVAARASVLPLTLFACLFAGLLALPWSSAEAARLALVTLALLLAHGTNNLLNDHIDYLTGLDRGNYFRALYGTHPLTSGLMSLTAHRLMILLTGTAALLLCLYLGRMLGTTAWWLAGAGVFFLLFYTYPLKRWAVGELSVFVVWGPLMVGGVYWAVSGDWGAEIMLLSVIYGLGPTVVIFAKHADKRTDDARRGVRTLPVVLGAGGSAAVIALLALLQVGLTIGWAVTEPAWSYLVILGALPALSGCLYRAARPRPQRRPDDYPANLWPLWYTIPAFQFARMSGALLVLGALADGLV
jgi:1,4-dihydroxy-2-naphthoate octaprenyltransferase